MPVVKIKQGDKYILHLNGAVVNDSSANELERTLKEIERINSDLKYIIINQNDPDFEIISRYMRMLIGFCSRIQDTKKYRIRFSNLSGKFKTRFELDLRSDKFQTYSSLEEATEGS